MAVNSFITGDENIDPHSLFNSLIIQQDATSKDVVYTSEKQENKLSQRCT